MVQPSNQADVVQEFIAHLALEPEKKFALEQNDPGESCSSLSVTRCYHHYGTSRGPYQCSIILMIPIFTFYHHHLCHP